MSASSKGNCYRRQDKLCRLGCFACSRVSRRAIIRLMPRTQKRPKNQAHFNLAPTFYGLMGVNLSQIDEVRGYSQQPGQG